ncbi:receptor-transporting protein 4 [Tenrec ecaudatus]|uniref:receptor-transporting protein 4 n=1 Tax=Tenrec ecaudatus TaxID=94439 RepID=UPI003F592C17
MDVDINSWERMFQTLLQQEEPWHRWTLRLDEMIQPDRVANGWKQYQQKAFGRFQCSSCSRAWASAKVQVLCHMNWNLQTSQGQVLMRFFAQRCKKCQLSQFEKPTFSSESTSTILNNLVQRILERFYGKDLSTVREVPVVAEVPLNGSHDTANCEACVLGFCKHGLQDPLTSFSYLDIGNFLPTLGNLDNCIKGGFGFYSRRNGKPLKEIEVGGH